MKNFLLCTVILKLVHLLHTVLLGNDLPLLRSTSFKGFLYISVFFLIDNFLFLFFLNLIINLAVKNTTIRIIIAATVTATAMIAAIVNQVS